MRAYYLPFSDVLVHQQQEGLLTQQEVSGHMSSQTDTDITTVDMFVLPVSMFVFYRVMDNNVDE
jgi:hypothetical protein